MKGFFPMLTIFTQLLRIHFTEILQMKVLQTLMIDLLALLDFHCPLNFSNKLLGEH